MEILEQLRDCIYKKPKIYEYTKIDDNLYIVKTDNTFDDRGGFMYRTVDLTHKNAVSCISFSLDEQILITLGYKYDGINSQFSFYACRMLNLNNNA